MTPKAARRAQASFDKQGTPEAQTAKGRVMPVAARRNKKR